MELTIKIVQRGLSPPTNRPNHILWKFNLRGPIKESHKNSHKMASPILSETGDYNLLREIKFMARKSQCKNKCRCSITSVACDSLGLLLVNLKFRKLLFLLIK